MTFTRAELLTAVERSPQLVAEHDRAGWVGLYTPDAQIEDPVGSRPHRGIAEIDRFYATFIAPREIAFQVRGDVVVDDTVIRDADLEVRMSGGVTMRIPAVLRYDLAAVGGDLKITRLQAFWELPGMVGKFLRNGPRAVPAGAALSVALLRNQGLGGAAGFLTGLRGAGTTGKRHVDEFLRDATAGNEVAVRRRLGKGARITVGERHPLTGAELLALLAGARWDKLIAAGRHVVAAIESPAAERGVLIADVESRPFTITRLRVFAGPGLTGVDRG
ncbi:nuclear transport factor 2 family protein [Mycolicibacterium litorale]|uniref:Steroid Delta-isomerase n=1 Tax=Mycolicibacterium litorale TaxID=758802 RepID=A0AAD1MR42_9MYCO|nr:nuclear transport factor 2 family protein [Mycolicibacterium litorale]MCV7418856.1 nuclear transport factor 2 family protein [Mycolicibacterium litorale]TDY00359.1 SnoaL-like protein [Mycolicibacterium litorale]BBY15809.1 steroid Delta-isomerase [Mycolicibacterium litorale]